MSQGLGWITRSRDDTVMFLDGNRASLYNCLEILLHFCYISRLAINFGKTNIHNIGQM